MLESGVYLVGVFIQLLTRTRRNDEGQRRTSYYVMLAVGGSAGAYQVKIDPDEYERLEDRKVPVGTRICVPVEAFVFNGNLYFRAADDVIFPELGAADNDT